jgi:predicted molibdopterin-dependent oxidoreductase YjgC
MFEGSFAGLCDLVLPGTSYLERDGTTVNLEGGSSASAAR